MLFAILILVAVILGSGVIVLARHCHRLRRMAAESTQNRSRPVSPREGGNAVLPVRVTRMVVHTLAHSEFKHLRNRRISRGAKIRPLGRR